MSKHTAAIKKLMATVLHGKAKCYYCGTQAQCVDHKIPKSAGGEDVIQNFLACCHECNAIKSTLPFEYHRIRLDMIKNKIPPLSKKQLDYLKSKGVSINKEMFIKFHGEG